MNRRRAFLIGLVTLLVAGGSQTAFCLSAYSMELFNNSESPFDLRAGSTWITVFPGKSQLFAYRDGVTIRVGDGRKLHFDRVDPPKEFTKKGLLSVALKAQMDSQFRIWLVMPATKWPALEPPQQPAGFPLTARQ